LPQEVKSLSLLQKETESGGKELESSCLVISWPRVQHHNEGKTCVEFRVFLCVIQCTPVDMYQNVFLMKEAASCSEYPLSHTASQPIREGSWYSMPWKL